MTKQTQPTSERRSFLTKMQLGAASLAAVALARPARAQTKATARFEPARHDKDNWMDELPGKHRLIFDTIYPNGLGEALVFGNNFLLANRNDYGLQNNDLAVIVVMRHISTAFAFNDVMWAKYGTQMSSFTEFVDPQTKAAPRSNLYWAGPTNGLPSFGVTLEALSKQGVQFAVCSMATRALAGMIAGAVSGNQDKVNAELIANLVTNARMVPAGIVAVSRAQERGYSLVASDRMS